jgi:hypothetical protein
MSALWLYHGVGAPSISDDACQYLDAAANFHAGRGLSTTVALFDEQVAYGRFPVPFTHFAPGYPLSIIAFTGLGMAPETAAWLLSALPFLAAIWLMWDIGTGLGARPGAQALCVALWIAHPAALSFASTAATEPLFIALLLGVVALIVRDVRTDGAQPFLLPAIGVSAAASYWVRYAGLFLIPVALLYVAWRAWRTGRTLPWAISAGLITVVFAGVIPLHNLRCMGSWQGGFSAGGGHSLRVVTTETVKALYHIVFGGRIVARIDGWSALAFVSFVAIAFLAVRAWRSRPPAAPKRLPAAALWIAALIAAYMGGIALAAMVSIASDFSRYYLPVYPVVIASAAAFALIRNRRQYVALILLVTALMAFQVRNLLAPQPPAEETRMRVFLGQETAPGIPIGQWLRTSVRPNDSIVAVNGQMLHYLVGRPVISVIEPVFTSRATNEAGFKALMQARHVRFLMVMPGASASDTPEQEETPFLRDLAAGIVPPWLTPGARTLNLAVFECAACAVNDARGPASGLAR